MEGRQCQSVMAEDADMELLQDHEQTIRKLEVHKQLCFLTFAAILSNKEATLLVTYSGK